MIARLIGVAGLAAGLTLTLLSVAPSAAATRKPIQQCMTDDGYGRFRPCSALYKRDHPNWKAGPECMTDDGYGRVRPCSSLYWWEGLGPPYNPNAPKKQAQ